MNLKFLSTLSLLLAGLIVTADVIPIAAATADVEESAAVVGGGMRGGYAILVSRIICCFRRRFKDENSRI